LRQIVYLSTAAGQQDAATIAAILAVSHERNLRDKVTGLLVAGGHRYLQVLEGPRNVVSATMRRISRDDRHLGVTVLVKRRIDERSFRGWSMACCDHLDLGDFATLAELIDQVRSQVSGRKLRQQIDCFSRSFVLPSQAVPESPPAPSPWTLASGYDSNLALDGSH
jgi:hypothetical protein